MPTRYIGMGHTVFRLTEKQFEQFKTTYNVQLLRNKKFFVLDASVHVVWDRLCIRLDDKHKDKPCKSTNMMPSSKT